jgi:hypothetical protein
MNTTRRSLVKTASALVALGMFYAASAYSDIPNYREWDAPIPWTHAGSACAPDEAALNKYAANYADFSFKSGAYSAPTRTGWTPISARCNIVDLSGNGDVNPSWNTFVVGYQDPDGTGLDTGIVARVMGVKRATGTLSTLATFKSNDYPANTRGEGFVFVSAAGFDFHNYEYFVQLDLTKSDKATAGPVVYSLRLVSATAIPQ